MLMLTDRATVNGTHRTRDGYLAADCRVAKTGIQIYSGYEVGRPDLTAVKVYRSADEVFAAAAMASAAHKPITLDHPAQGVTADRWKELAVGWTGEAVARDGEFLRVPMMIADGAAIQSIESGKRELSGGYSCQLKWGAGRTATGETFDAQQTGITLNHIAIVARGRAGSEVRIGDSATAFLLDAMGQPRRLIDRDTGSPFRPNHHHLAAMRNDAAKLGMPLDRFLADVLRYQLAD